MDKLESYDGETCKVGTLHPEIEMEWSLWRVVRKLKISPDEVFNKWNLKQVMKMNAIFDMEEAYDMASSRLQEVIQKEK